MARSIVRLECENEELRAEVAMLKQGMVVLAQERDEARMQYRTTELLGMELVKTIDQLKAEKAAIFAKLVSLQAGSRRATLDEIAESVREKYDERHEGEGMQND
jgi:cell division protein FtsB